MKSAFETWRDSDHGIRAMPNDIAESSVLSFGLQRKMEIALYCDGSLRMLARQME